MSVGQSQFFSRAFLTFHAKSILDHDGKQKAEVKLPDVVAKED